MLLALQEQYRNQLLAWVELSIAKGMPMTLLVMAHALTLTSPVPEVSSSPCALWSAATNP